jgi:hypothetical protein
MAIYNYLSLVPEALVVSMLEPEAFGTYLATGTKKRSHEVALYFDLKSDLKSDYFGLEEASRHCVPHPDGAPKRSVYVSIYRVLEHVPLDAIGSLWLTTRDGRVLELKQGSVPPSFSGRYHLYQELCPVTPLIASTKAPADFCRFITDPAVRISVPKICFFELNLGELQDDPAARRSDTPDNERTAHLRNCLMELADKRKTTKTVNRIQSGNLSYDVIKSGYFVGDHSSLLYFPFPSHDELEARHHDWWRSATVA